MKTLTILLKFSGFTFLILIIILIILIFFTGLKLPANSNTIIERVINSELPELVTGKTGYAISDGYKIWYESINPKGLKKGTILLFSGSATDALMWPQSFISEFVNSGSEAPITKVTGF